MSTLEQTLDDFSPTSIETELTNLLQNAGEGNERAQELVQAWNVELQSEADSLGESHAAKAEARVRMEMRRALVYYSAGLHNEALISLADALILVGSDNHGDSDVLGELVYELGDSLFEEGWEDSLYE